MSVLRRNSLVVLPAGVKFQLAGTMEVETWMRVATNTLGTVRHSQGVVDRGNGLVTSPEGFYVTVVEELIDESGRRYGAGTVLFLPPTSAVQVMAKVGGGGKTGEPLKLVPSRPYPPSAKAMAGGVALATAGFVTAWVVGG